jgi:hypothetical protein
MGFHFRRNPWLSMAHVHEYEETIAEAKVRRALAIAEVEKALRILDGAIDCDDFQEAIDAAKQHLAAYLEAGR